MTIIQINETEVRYKTITLITLVQLFNSCQFGVIARPLMKCNIGILKKENI